MTTYPVGPLSNAEARIIGVLGAIGEPEVNHTVDLLLRYDAENAKEITIYASAQGGDIIQSLKLLDVLQLMRAPVTVVAFGQVEGAGLILLAAAHRRIVFPSVLLSTAGLWSLPDLHGNNRQPIGLHAGHDVRQQMLAKLREQAEQAFARAPHKTPSLLADPDQQPRLFNATESLALGLADSIISGPQRRLLKPLLHKIPSAASHVHHL